MDILCSQHYQVQATQADSISQRAAQLAAMGPTAKEYDPQPVSKEEEKEGELNTRTCLWLRGRKEEKEDEFEQGRLWLRLEWTYSCFDYEILI